MLARRCLNFVNNEYRRRLIDFELTVNMNDELVPKNAVHSKHVESRCVRERSHLFELLQILYKEEVSGRRFNVKEADNAILNLKTELKERKPEEINTDIEQTIEQINGLNDTDDNAMVDVCTHEVTTIEIDRNHDVDENTDDPNEIHDNDEPTMIETI